jgi:hypothetical protein
MDAPVVPDAPGLSLRGVPERFEPGRTYAVTVALHREGMGAGGFQLSARSARGKQAGEWRALDERARVVRDSATGVSYVVHTMPGTALVSPDSARWTLEWTAPAERGDSVVFSAIGNAANGDDSNFGRRHPRIRQGQAPPQRVALSRLRHSLLQLGQTLRPICPGTDRR